MRLSASLLLLPVLATAQEQVPLGDRVQGWLNKAKSLLPTTPSAATAANTPTQQATKPSAPATKHVTEFNSDNWRSLLAPVDPKTSKADRDWLIFITGGNKTCFGNCIRAGKAFNDSVSLFAADPSSPRLGRLDCENERLLCSIWSTGPPALWYFRIPEETPAGEPKQRTPLHVTRLNITTVTSDDIYKFHSEKGWQKKPDYQGALHPTDGWLAEYGLNTFFGYIAYGLGVLPSWAIMITVSLISRSLMSRQMRGVGERDAQRAAAQPSGGAQ